MNSIMFDILLKQRQRKAAPEFVQNLGHGSSSSGSAITIGNPGQQKSFGISIPIHNSQTRVVL